MREVLYEPVGILVVVVYSVRSAHPVAELQAVVPGADQYHKPGRVQASDVDCQLADSSVADHHHRAARLRLRAYKRVRNHSCRLQHGGLGQVRVGGEAVDQACGHGDVLREPARTREAYLVVACLAQVCEAVVAVGARAAVDEPFGHHFVPRL